MTQMKHQDQVADGFGAHAQAYVNSAVHGAGQDLDDLTALLAQCRPARVLDLGTGGGHVAFRAAAVADQVVAYDLSPAMLRAVAAEATERGHSNIQTRQGPAESLPFADHSFDAVLTRFSAHHWRDLPRGLAEARRVLRPGGMALFIDVVAPAARLADTWLQTLELMRDGSHLRDYSTDEWQTMLTTAGFAPRLVQAYRLRMEFAPWVARIGTPAPLITALRLMLQSAPAEVAAHFAIETDSSFTIDSCLIAAD